MAVEKELRKWLRGDTGAFCAPGGSRKNKNNKTGAAESIMRSILDAVMLLLDAGMVAMDRHMVSRSIELRSIDLTESGPMVDLTVRSEVHGIDKTIRSRADKRATVT